MLLLCGVQGRCVAKTDYLENCRIYYLTEVVKFTSVVNFANSSEKFSGTNIPFRSTNGLGAFHPAA